MVNYKIKKLMRGYCSVRDYIASNCIQRNESLCITYGDDIMILTPDQLKNYKQLTDKPFRSQFQGSYYLWDYRWHSSRQASLF
jgi:hypothetical protein